MWAHFLATTAALESDLQTLRKEHEALRLEAAAMRRCLDKAGVLAQQAFEEELANGRAELAESQEEVPKKQIQRGGSLPFFPASPVAATAAEAVAGWGPSAKRRSTSARLSRSLTAPSPSPERTSSARRLRDLLLPEQPALDLFEIMQPLLDKSFGLGDQLKAMKALTRHLKASAELPTTWSGPGTPLNAAVKAGRIDLVRMLLKARANANEQDSKGVAPLHLAVFDGHMELCKMLLTAKADVDCCDCHGQTPLFFAPSRDICKLLIDKRAEISALNRKGQSALHLAGRAGLHEVLAWLAARSTKGLLELKDFQGNSARQYAQQAKPPMASSSFGVAAPRRAGGATATTSLTNSAASAADGQAVVAVSPEGPPQRPQEYKLYEEPEHFLLSSQASRGSPVLPATPYTELEVQYSGLDAGKPGFEQHDMVRAAVEAAALEAAAAVASAAVATAAELEAAASAAAAASATPEEAAAPPAASSPSVEAPQPVLEFQRLEDVLDEAW